MNSRRFRLLALLSLSATLSISAANLGFANLHTQVSCTHARGRLFNASELGGAGRMTGTISGTYWYDVNSYREWDPEDASRVVFNSGSSIVEGKKGTIAFQEYAALDYAELESFNGAVLLVVTGGTGRWDGASGHIALSGFFHPESFEGEWDYQGEICVP